MDPLKSLPEQAVTLECQQLSVLQMSGARERPSLEFIALGHTVIEGRSFAAGPTVSRMTRARICSSFRATHAQMPSCGISGSWVAPLAGRGTSNSISTRLQSGEADRRAVAGTERR